MYKVHLSIHGGNQAHGVCIYMSIDAAGFIHSEVVLRVYILRL